MKILVIGHGGREHALAWKSAQSPMVSTVFVAPGNAGTALEPMLKNIPIDSTDIISLLNFVKSENIELTIVGPEIPLAMGIVDLFQKEGLKIFGPTKLAAQLESSKIFAKDFLIRHGIPTAKYHSFISLESALSYVQQQHMPLVIKKNSLSFGKGVIVALTLHEAELAIRTIFQDNTVTNTECKVIIEEFLEGEEVSFTVMVDGNYVLPMETSQDHKRVGNRDTGLNTGGMGAYSPTSIVNNEMFYRIMNDIIWPTIKGMNEEGNTYTGCLYIGLMIDPFRNPKVIEFNCRFGDPEAQSLMMRLKSDFVDLCLATIEKRLNKKTIEWEHRVVLSVVMATRDYPNKYHVGDEIFGLSVTLKKDMKIFHSGTKLLSDGTVLTNGGRVLCITALGKSIAETHKYIYNFMPNIYWRDSFSRTDIGYREIVREKTKQA